MSNSNNLTFLVITWVLYLSRHCARPRGLYQFVAHELEGKGYYCTICSKSLPKRMEVRNHIESIHFPDIFCYQCNVCAKEFRSKNALKVHNATVLNVKGDSTY